MGGMKVGTSAPAPAAQPSQSTGAPAAKEGGAQPAGARPASTGPASPATGSTARPAGSASAHAPGMPMSPLVVTEGYEVHRPAEAPKMGEAVARPNQEVPSDASRAREQRSAETRGNPFQALPKAAAPLPKLGAQVSLREVLPTPLPVMQKLAQVEGKLGGESVQTFQQVRQGFMLVAADGQDKLPKDLPRSELGRFLSKMDRKANIDVGHKEAVEGFLKLNARFLAAGQANIQALVQAVLRESYLMQNEILWDMAEKVKFFNEQKRRLRDRLNDLRQAKAEWTTAAKGQEQWMHPEGIVMQELDDNGVWQDVITTAADIEAWDARRRDLLSDPYNADGGFGIHAFDSKESLLTPEDKALLDELQAESKDEEWLEDHESDIITAVQRMNRSEFDNYMFNKDGKGSLLLSMSTQDKRVLASLLTNLTPAQTLHYVANNPGNPHAAPGQWSEADWAKFGITAAGGTAAAVGSQVAAAAAVGTIFGPIGTLIGGIIGGVAAAVVGAGVAGGVGAPLIQKTAHGGPFTSDDQDMWDRALERSFEVVSAEVGISRSVGAEGAKDLLERLRETAPDPEKMSGQRPKLGEPKRLHTSEDLTAYVESLEDSLNQVGDDAQLANVDLQSALQKQQQTLQMLSNISKMLHDTALATVRKLGQ